MKPVILTWTHSVCNVKYDKVNNFWGLGDIIRGAIKLYQLSKKMNFELIVDISQHPLSKYLIVKEHNYSEFVKQVKDKIEFVFPRNVENYILEKNKDKDTNIIFFHTNDTCDENIDEECKKFIKDILTPKKEFLEELDEFIKKIPYKNYNILHFRLGDFLMISNSEIDLSKYLNILQKYNFENNVLISDNQTFKKIASEKFGIFSFDTNIQHIGYPQHNDLKDTLLEFYCMLGTECIKTYSIYGWLSGFVNSVKLIYDVKIYNINDDIKEGKININNNQIKHFISFGDDKYVSSKKRIYDESIDSKFFDTVKIYSPDDFDDEFKEKNMNFIQNNKRGHGYWIWKLYFVLKKLYEINYNDILVYADAGCSINKNAQDTYNKYVEILNFKDDYDIICIQLLGDFHLEHRWTKNDIFEYLKIDKEHQNTAQIMGGIFYCRKTDRLIKFLKSIYDINCKNYNLIDDSPSKSKNHLMFCENRHDQSMFSVMLKQNYTKKYIIQDNTGLLGGKYDINSPILGTRIRI
jgi:hypothetical protein